MNAETIIETLGMQPLPDEGGYFVETYRATGAFKAHGGTRNYCTAIYYLITPESWSSFHRVKSDEIWHFHAGDPAEMVQIDPEGKVTRMVIGSDLPQGHRPQVVAPADCWQATKLLGKGKWALYSCTVSPGFEYEDTEIPKRDDLLKLLPGHEALVTEFTHRMH